MYVDDKCTLAFKELTFCLLLHKALSSGSQAIFFDPPQVINTRLVLLCLTNILRKLGIEEWIVTIIKVMYPIWDQPL